MATFSPPARLFAVARASLLWPTLAPASEPTTASPLHLFVFLLRPDRSPPHATFSEVPGFPSSAPSAPPPVAAPPPRSDSESARLPEGASPPGIRRTPGPPHEKYIFARARPARHVRSSSSTRLRFLHSPPPTSSTRGAPRRAAPPSRPTLPPDTPSAPTCDPQDRSYSDNTPPTPKHTHTAPHHHPARAPCGAASRYSAARNRALVTMADGPENAARMTGAAPRADFSAFFWGRECAAARVAHRSGGRKNGRHAALCGQVQVGPCAGAGAGAGAGAVEAVTRGREAPGPPCWRWAPAGARAGANWRHLPLSGASWRVRVSSLRPTQTLDSARPFEAPSLLTARALAGRGDGDDVRSASMVQRARAHGTRTHHVRPGALHPAGPHPASTAIPDPTFPTQNECYSPPQHRTPNFDAWLACW